MKKINYRSKGPRYKLTRIRLNFVEETDRLSSQRKRKTRNFVRKETNRVIYTKEGANLADRPGGNKIERDYESAVIWLERREVVKSDAIGAESGARYESGTNYDNDRCRAKHREQNRIKPCRT